MFVLWLIRFTLSLNYCFGNEVSAEADSDTCKAGEGEAEFVFQFNQEELLSLVRDNDRVITVRELTVGSLEYKPIFETKGDGSLIIQNVESIYSAAEGIHINANDGFTVASPCVTIVIKGDTLTFSGDSEFGNTANDKTKIQPSNAKTYFDTTAYTGTFKAKILKYSDSTTIVGVTVGFANKDNFVADTDVTINFATLCIGSDKTTALGICQSEEGLESVVFEFQNTVPRDVTMTTSDSIYSTVEDATFDANGYSQKPIFKTAGSNGRWIIQNVESIYSAAEGIHINANDGFTVASPCVTIVIKGDTLTFSGDSEFGNTANDKTKIQPSNAKTYFVPTAYTGTFKAKILKYSDSATVVKVLYGFSNLDQLVLDTDVSVGVIKMICVGANCPSGSFSRWENIENNDEVHVQGTGISIPKLAELGSLQGVEVILTNGASVTLKEIEAFNVMSADKLQFGDTVFTISLDSGAEASVNIYVPNNGGGVLAISGTAALSSLSVFIFGEGKYTNEGATSLHISPFLRLQSAPELKRIIACPEGETTENCLNQVKTIESNADEESSLFYNPLDSVFGSSSLYSSKIVSRQGLPHYLYLGFSQKLTIPVNSLKVQKVLHVPKIPAQGAKLLSVVEKVLYTGTTDLNTAVNSFTVKSNGNSIQVDSVKAPSSTEIEVGDRLNIQQSDAASQSSLKIDLKLTKDTTVIAFDKIVEKGPKFNLNPKESQTLNVYTGSGTKEEVEKVLTISGSSKVTYAEGTPEDPVTSEPSDNKLSGGAIAGIVIGCVVFVAIVVVIVYIFIIKKKNDASESNPSV